MLGVYVRTSDNTDLPWWAIAPLTVIGVLIAWGLLNGIAWLARTGERRRFNARVAAVAAAAGDDAVHGPAAVKAAAADLFRRMWTAWDAVDRERLAEIGTAEIMEDWNAALDGNRAAGRRMRAEIRSEPRIDMVGLNGPYATVRIRAKLYAYFETPDGKRHGLAEANHSKRWKYDHFWTFTRDRDRWRISWIRDPATDAEQALTEDIVPPGVTRAGS